MDWPSWHDQAVPFRAACHVTENCQESRLNETDWLDQTNSNDQDIKENMSFEKERKRKKKQGPFGEAEITEKRGRLPWGGLML